MAEAGDGSLAKGERGRGVVSDDVSFVETPKSLLSALDDQDSAIKKANDRRIRRRDTEEVAARGIKDHFSNIGALARETVRFAGGLTLQQKVEQDLGVARAQGRCLGATYWGSLRNHVEVNYSDWSPLTATNDAEPVHDDLRVAVSVAIESPVHQRKTAPLVVFFDHHAHSMNDREFTDACKSVVLLPTRHQKGADE